MLITILSIVFGSLAILGIILSFVFSTTNYWIKSKGFSIKNEFPSELYFKNKNKTVISIFYYLFIGTSLALSLLFQNHISTLELDSTVRFLAIFSSILFSVGLITSGLEIFIPPFFVKPHTILYLLNHCVFFLSAMIYGFINLICNNVFGEPKYLILAILGFVLAVSYIFLTLDPRVLTWTKLDKEKTTSDEIVYVRPKFISLAFYEWLTYIFIGINIILLVLFIVL